MEDRKVEGTKIMKRQIIVRDIPRTKLMMKPAVLCSGSSSLEIQIQVCSPSPPHLSNMESARSQTDLQHMVIRGEIRN